MSSPVCIGCGLDTDSSGLLVVDLAPSTPCSPNRLTCSSVDGLKARQVMPSMRETVSLTRSSVAQGGLIFAQATQADAAVQYDTGTGVGAWTIANGAVTVACNGVYTADLSFSGVKNTGFVRGLQARIFAAAQVITTADLDDFTNTIDLSTAGDGPEMAVSRTRHLAAGNVVTWRGFLYVEPAGSSADLSADFTLTYLGEQAP